MTTGRRLQDVLGKFMVARAELIGEMSIGTPLGSAASSHQLNRLRDLQSAIEIIRSAVGDADALRQAVLHRDGQQHAQQERRRTVAAEPLPDQPFVPL